MHLEHARLCSKPGHYSTALANINIYGLTLTYQIFSWHIWKARNAVIFDHIDSTPSDILRRVVQGIDSWSCRFNPLKPELLVSGYFVLVLFPPSPLIFLPFWNNSCTEQALDQ
jgi:hypothetical protein